MHNLHLQFAYPWAPWLFLLLIPVFLFTLIPYFRMDKRYRRTRNRVTSIVLHVLIMTLAVCVLTGFIFTYEVTNPENELILLVDVSDTENVSQKERDKYVKTVLEESAYDDFRVCVVTFGFTQVMASPFTYDTKAAYDNYLGAELPDTTATDIAAALRFASGLFANPDASKIVLITDGKETDESAASVINYIASQGTQIDVIHVDSDFEFDTVQVAKVSFPTYHVNINEEFPVDVTIHSRSITEASIVEFYDNGELDPDKGMQVISFIEGTQTVTFHPTFTTRGLHKVEIKVSQTGDTLTVNNSYCAYYYLEFYTRVLIIEQKEGESEALTELLTSEDFDFDVTVLNLKAEEDIPKSVDDLREYDQVILNNIANNDLEPIGLDELLYSYVHDYGGGLFTVGGNGDDGEAHAYNRLDMVNTLYQQMLPVEVVNYTPPLGVVIIVDISGSMGSAEDPDSRVSWAKQGAIACLSALNTRDYIGVMTLDTDYGTELPMTPYTSNNESYIREKILSIRGTGGTCYEPTLRRAGQMLSRGSLPYVDIRHIILVSDGGPSDYEEAVKTTRENFELNGITLSYINTASDRVEDMIALSEVGHGKYYQIDGNLSELTTKMRDDLNADEIKEMTYEPFHPQVYAEMSHHLLNGVSYGMIEDENGDKLNKALNAQLGGFYGVRERRGSDVILRGKNEVPIYAQWSLGKGMVGSFMCDLNGTWSGDFLTDIDAQRFLFNVIANLMPTEDLRTNEITVTLREENYINQMSIFTSFEEGQTIRATIADTTTGVEISLNEVTNIMAGENADLGFYVTLALTEANSYSRCNFIVKATGTYRIHVEKVNADGTVAATYDAYKDFSYSLEYAHTDDAVSEALIEQIARRGSGHVIRDFEEIGLIFENFVTDLPRSFDPRWLFMGLAIALFLLDITVRKFKFKWPHEIIRERREKRADKRR